MKLDDFHDDMAEWCDMERGETRTVCVPLLVIGLFLIAKEMIWR